MEVFFGILMVVVAGLCSVVTGIAVSRCTATGLNYNVVQGINAVWTVILSLIVAFLLKGFPATLHAAWIVSGLMLLAGIANYYTFVLTGIAMRTGHNGLVWALMQSGMVSSFLMGAIFYHDDVTPLRVAGLVLIILGVLLMGIAKNPGDKRVKGSRASWLVPTLFAILLVAVTHCSIAVISYYPDLKTVSPFYRGALLSLGMTFCYGLSLCTTPSMRMKPRKGEWNFAILLLLLGILSSYILFMPALDLLAAHKLGGIGYPVCIGVCVAGFSLYSVLFLREKTNLAGWSGMIASIAGIVCISLK